jgi:4-hydroxy-tetrahydrodipicolinate reductase
MPTKIVVTGAKGKMGQTILNCAQNDSEIKVVGSIDVGQPLEAALQPGAVIIDFSHHAATPAFAEIALQAKCPMVIGTTGFTEAEKSSLHKISKTIPMIIAPNMSVGVNLLFNLAQVVTSVLKKDFDIEILEKHHRRKKDSPSGTAARLLEIVAETKGAQVSKVAKHGRVGDVGERTKEEIGVHAIRGGDYVGEHTVIYAGDGEVIEITHKANSREIFAKGALVAAKWLSSAKPGLYDMSDVLGLK